MGHRQFAVAVVALCLAGYAALLGLARSPYYCSLSASFADAAPCYQTDVRGSRAELLLVGDSSLLYGIRPDRLAATGAGTAHNLGMPGPSFAFQPRTLIDTYLAANARPRAVILYFTPWATLSDRRISDPQWAPLGIFLLRHGSWHALAHLLSVRPAALVELPALIFGNLTSRSHGSPAFRQQLIDRSGWLDYSASGQAPLAPDCAGLPPADTPLPLLAHLPDNAAAIAALKRHYATQGLPVLAYVAPTATCDGHLAAIRRAYAGVADNIPVQLPAPDFVDDVRDAPHSHASISGVDELTAELAGFVRTAVRPRIAAAQTRAAGT